MHVELSEHARSLVERFLECGYESPEDVVEQALNQFAQFDTDRLNALIEEGYESAERDGWIPAEEVMAKARAIVEEAKRREAQGAA